MPKSDQPDSSLRNSKTRKAKKPAEHPAKPIRLDPSPKAPLTGADSELGTATVQQSSAARPELDTSPSPTILVTSDRATARQLGIVKRVRTPLPPASGGFEDSGRLAREARSSEAVTLQGQRLGVGKRVRTPLPPPVSDGLDRGRRGARQPPPGQLGSPRNLLSVLSESAAGPVAKKLKEKAEQFQSIQEYLHNPVAFDLRGNENQTTSTPEEIESRKGEVRYQIQLMKSVVAVLTEELHELEKAQPQTSALPDNVRA
jgi:hypothetical protein